MSLLSLLGARPLCRTLGADLELGLRLLRGHGGDTGDTGDTRGWRPLGVVAVVLLGPCSLPALLSKLGPLLAMGNTAVVLSPPPAAPPLLLLGALAGEGAALPPGVLNVLAGPPGLARALRAHPEVTAVTALGGSQEELRALLWGSPLRGPRFLGRGPRGGRPLLLVLDSADLDGAATAAVTAASAGDSAGGTCAQGAGGCVLLAQEPLLAPLRRRLRARLGGLRPGHPAHPQTQLGPLPPGTPHPEELLRAAREEGAQVFQAPLPPLPGGGQRFVPPTLIWGVTPTSRCLREPAAGPLLLLLGVRGPPEAVAVASALPGAGPVSLWAQDVGTALDTAERLPQALVCLNSLDVPEPPVGSAWGAADTELPEALREFGCPPWEEPPEALSPAVTGGDPEGDPEGDTGGDPEGDPEGDTGGDPEGDPELAQAVAAARGAAPGWARLPGPSRARVLRGAAAALPGGPGTPGGGDSGDIDPGLQGALLRWAARAERLGGAVQELPGGRALLSRRPLGVLGVAWGWPRPPALELLLPALALGNAVVVVAPPGGLGAAQRLRKALVAAGLPGGVLAVLPGPSRGCGRRLARQRPDGLWLCGGDADCDWASVASVPHVWGVPAGLLGAPGRDPPPGAERELELRCSRPRCLWLPGGGP